jgi:hypothetical protein
MSEERSMPCTCLACADAHAGIPGEHAVQVPDATGEQCAMQACVPTRLAFTLHDHPRTSRITYRALHTSLLYAFRLRERPPRCTHRALTHRMRTPRGTGPADDCVDLALLPRLTLRRRICNVLHSALTHRWSCLLRQLVLSHHARRWCRCSIVPHSRALRSR